MDLKLNNLDLWKHNRIQNITDAPTLTSIYMYIYKYIYKRDSFGLRNTKECSMTYRHYSHQLTTTACFAQEESSGGKQFRKHVSCFYAQGGNVGVLSLK